MSCSSEKPSDMTKQKPSEIGSGSITETSQTTHVYAVNGSYSIEITPKDASRNSTLYVVPKGFNLPDARIEWLVNGKPVISSLPYQFKAADTRRGDTVQAKAIIEGREILSNIIQITNTPPEISKVKIMPEVFKPGDMLYVDVAGSDIDGDEVTISYEWTKNGEPAGDKKQLGVPLKKGDKISVKITPFNGESYGRSVVLHREIMNMPPSIVEDKGFKYNFDGKVYTYQVKAFDPDGDQLMYSLKSAPQGMNINSTTGLIQWDVPADFKGKAPFTVSVTDGHGGEAMQNFTLDIKAETKK